MVIEHGVTDFLDDQTLCIHEGLNPLARIANPYGLDVPIILLNFINRSPVCLFIILII